MKLEALHLLAVISAIFLESITAKYLLIEVVHSNKIGRYLTTMAIAKYKSVKITQKIISLKASKPCYF